jgi:radical SAM superfamily enzyme YgiQ (UPF0313 family)
MAKDIQGLLTAKDWTFPMEWSTADKKLNVVLCQTPSKSSVECLFPHTEEGKLGYKPPLGILYVGTYLQTYTDHNVYLLDAQAQEWFEEQLVDAILEKNPDVVGLTCWTDFWYGAYRTAELLKQRAPHVHICMGGPHLGVYPEITLLNSPADSVVLGDGEVPFFLLVNCIARNLKPNNIPGVHFKEHGVRENCDKFYIHKDQDSLPHPNRHLLPIEMYSSVLGENQYTTTMITSRGCPHKCTFCKLNFQKTLQRSAESVVDEFEMIYKLGISEVEVYDDTFTWSAKRVQDICKGLIDRNIKLSWAIRDRVSGVKEENLDLLRKAGCTRIHLGIEAGNDKTLKVIRKNTNIQMAAEAVRLVKKYGFTTLCYFMVGLPDETYEDCMDTIKFAIKADPDYALFNIAIPYAGTEMYSQALQKGVIRSGAGIRGARPAQIFRVRHSGAWLCAGAV